MSYTISTGTSYIDGYYCYEDNVWETVKCDGCHHNELSRYILKDLVHGQFSLCSACVSNHFETLIEQVLLSEESICTDRTWLTKLSIEKLRKLSIPEVCNKHYYGAGTCTCKKDRI